jgi:peptide/nickel transport system permease protein
VSLRTKRPVIDLVGDRLVNSLKLASVAMLFTVVISLPLGVIAAVYRGRIWDRVAMATVLLGQSLPSFWTSIIFILVFAVMLGWFPTSGSGGWQHYILPAVSMGWFTSAGIVRLLRSSTLEVLDSEYIKLARLKGLREVIVVSKHAVRNALIPVITFVGFMYGIIIASAITTEVVFAWPGLGRLAYEAVLWRDFPLLQLTVLTWACLIILINFGIDLVYVLLDPRIRL